PRIVAGSGSSIVTDSDWPDLVRSNASERPCGTPFPQYASCRNALAATFLNSNRPWASVTPDRNCSTYDFRASCPLLMSTQLYLLSSALAGGAFETINRSWAPAAGFPA